MTTWVFRTMIVPADFAPLARALATGLESEAAATVFTTGLSPTGREPATHFISNGMIGEEFAALISDPEALFAAGQGSVTLEQCQALLAAATISDVPGGVFSLLSEIGLQLVNEEPN